ncbi:hypothetical protein INR49_007903 [Caranx melampygus]|nr:hypothetical protein INR49_007903 [Caranx melampygus]
MSRNYNDELQYLDKITSNCWRIKKGFVPNMRVEGNFYVNDSLEKLMFEELRNACRGGGVGGFLPAMKQIGNVAALPGIVHVRGVGFDINCGVRLLRTNLDERDVQPVKEQLAQSLFNHIPVGVGSKGVIPMGAKTRTLGTLGAGNHYAEIQVVDEIYNDYAAKKMGIDHKGQVCVMIHSGSRGLGHQGRALSRAKSRRNLDFQDVLDKLADQGIAIRVASPKLVMEEAPESYKNVTDVVNTCHDAGISKKAIKLRPIAVIKG